MKHYVGILVCLVLLSISVLEIYNFSALYKDQVEHKAMLATNVSNDYCLNLIDKSSELTSVIDFFSYCAVTSFVTLLYLTYKKYINRKKSI